MTVPEENRPKTPTTDPELTDPDAERRDPTETGDGTGRTPREYRGYVETRSQESSDRGC
ncbi:hypothetical protein SAMN06297387_107208 [Streptomyces zhaozhouensis]|uniref:Uncharacterized protein n=1 Tax=Streptomyces zhaozhouensis TaxID=1300267 RepID=A0A286DW95_9ACTN|nr:hypothetical protein [Streptomyces zhaozhouensis]SOD62834.1 hypothetical protein SAMN06297387_107208 [Streptomyces zhaozhouensis]